MKQQRILGIDPGSRMTGFGLIESNGLQHTYIASGVIRIPTHLTLPERIARIVHDLLDIIDAYQPQVSAVEQVFVNVNPAATLVLGQARGAAIAALTLRGLNVAEYTALQVKQSVVGRGHAPKEQVAALVLHHLKLSGSLQADAADGLAVALCHAHHASLGSLGAGIALKSRRKSSRADSLKAFQGH